MSKDKARDAWRLIRAAQNMARALGSLGQRTLQRLENDCEVYISADQRDFNSDVVVCSNWNNTDHYELDVRTDGLVPCAYGKRVDDNDIMERLSAAIERLDGVEIDWSDQVTSCADCNKLLRTEPTHMSWAPNYTWDENGALCRECELNQFDAESDEVLDAFVDGYLSAALWSTTAHLPGSDENDDTSFSDAGLGVEDIDPITLDNLRAECAAWLDESRALIVDSIPKMRNWIERHSDGTWEHENILAVFESAGHDFWLDRNGHGVGFSDRPWSDSEALDKSCGWRTSFGEVDLYAGDDGKIYAMGYEHSHRCFAHEDCRRTIDLGRDCFASTEDDAA